MVGQGVRLLRDFYKRMGFVLFVAIYALSNLRQILAILVGRGSSETHTQRIQLDQFIERSLG